MGDRIDLVNRQCGWALMILAYHPKVATVLVYERFAGFGLDAAQPIALILILVALVVFISLRLVLLPRHE